MRWVVRYLVIGYDDDQQQTTFDFVTARDKTRAREAVEIARPYLTATCAVLTAFELREMIVGLDQDEKAWWELALDAGTNVGKQARA
jgi:hypothetical protein